MRQSEQISIAGIPCDLLTPEQVLQHTNSLITSDSFGHIVTLNAEMVVEAQDNAAFRRALEQATLRVPDSAGIYWAASYLSSPKKSFFQSLITFLTTPVTRASGVELIPNIIRQATEQHQSVYILGGNTTHNTQAIERLRQEIPGADIRTSSDHTFQLDGPADILDDIKNIQPAVLFVAYGAPKQALWIAAHAHLIPSVRLAMGVGGSFDTISGALPRAPRWMRTHNLEWLWRLILQPGRLPRIFRAIIFFPMLIRRQKHSNS